MSATHTSGLRRRVSLTLVAVALISVTLLSTVNYLFASELLRGTAEQQLEGVRDGRVEALQNGLGRVESLVSTMAADPSVTEALTDLAAGYEQLDAELTPEQVNGLAEIYDDEFLPAFAVAGIELSATSLVPTSAAGRAVQQLYLAENPGGFDEREQLDDAGDGSAYSAAHAAHHPLLRQLMQTGAFTDLILVDGQSGEVVYSVQKRNDLGTNGSTWPDVDIAAIGGLGPVLDQLSNLAIGEATFSDAVFSIPTAGVPVLYAAASVRSGSSVIGTLVAQIPISALNDLMTAGEDWKRLGLETTGEAYIVGADSTLRSESRAWIEDPDDYLRRYLEQSGEQRGADLIATVGSPVLIQQVDNDAVTSALDGDAFVGTVTNYLGVETLATSRPAQVGTMNWVVIVEKDTSESDAALDSLLKTILVGLAILLPLIGLIGWLLGRMLTKPARALVHAASQIADGKLDVEVGEFGRNELGDLARQFESIAGQLDSQEQAIIGEEQRIVDLMGAAFPARLVDRVRQGEHGIEDAIDTATAVSIMVDGIPEATSTDQDLALEITNRVLAACAPLMVEYRVEQVQRSAGSQRYLTGLGQDGAGVDDAVSFVFAAIERLRDVGAEFGHTFTVRAGLSAGDVATGVLGTQQVSFGAWGDPPGISVALASRAEPGQVLVDSAVADQIGSMWNVEPLDASHGRADGVEAHVVSGRLGVSPAP